MTRTLPVGFVRIVSTDPPITVQARLGPDRPDVSAGYGGWVEVARPRRKPLSIWVGSPALRMNLSILLDAFTAGASIERQVAQLERLATPSAADGNPARLRISGRGGGIPHQDRVWVIDSIPWGDALVNRNGDRARQQATLSLMEFVAEARISPAKAQAAKKTKPGASSKRVVAARKKPAAAHSLLAAGDDPDFGAGDDLLSIAARELGDADRWVEIAQLNGLRDPRAIRPGQVIRLP